MNDNTHNILIISSNSDYDTTNVIKWLNYFKKKWFRINIEDVISLSYIDIKNKKIVLSVNGIDIDINQYKTLFYRRGQNWNFFKPPNLFSSSFDEIRHVIQSIFKSENESILRYVQYLLSYKRKLTDFNNGDINKLLVLEEANNVGLRIPESYILANKKKGEEILKSKSYITKSISSNLYSFSKIRGYYSYTELVSENDILNESFPPSLVQEKIEKDVELRIFFLENIFYTMAIFSQVFSESEIDNRKNNETIRVPFRLPQEVKKKLILLNKKLGLKTGSIDMIRGKNGDYTFLEVNPVGQIGMTSIPCNFQIHKKIAEWL